MIWEVLYAMMNYLWSGYLARIRTGNHAPNHPQIDALYKLSRVCWTGHFKMSRYLARISTGNYAREHPYINAIYKLSGV